MVKNRRLRRRVVLMLFTLLVAGLAPGCGSQGGDQTESASLLYRSYLNDPAGFAPDYEQVEYEEMTKCMRANGFDYLRRVEEREFTAGSEIGSPEDVETWGLGISTRVYSNEIVAAPAIGITGGIGEPWDSESDALVEESDSFLSALDDCEMRANEIAQDAFPELMAVVASYDNLLGSAEYEAALQELNIQVADCMQTKGHPYGNELLWDDDFTNRAQQFDATVSQIYGSAEDLPSGGPDFDWRTARHFSYQGGTLTPAQNETLAAIQDEERQVARDLMACGYFPWEPSDQTAPIFDGIAGAATNQ